MKLSSFKTIRYSLPFKKPLIFKTEEIKKREGIILILKFDDNTEGIGEIAPLPGFSKSKIEDCLNNLKEILSSLRDKPENLKMFPEVRFGFETAIFNALANKQNLPLSRLLSDSAGSEVIVNGLAQGNKDTIIGETQRLLGNGFKLIKIKAGGNVRDDIDCLTEAIKIVNNRAKIHVDVNQKWSFNDAVLFAKKINSPDIIYLEEPFADITKIPEFFGKTGICVAIDESLNLFEFDQITSLKGVKFLVIKPTILGGIKKALKLIGMGREKGLSSVISSSFESSIGLFTLAHIAAAGGKEVTAGLDTLKFFSKDLLKKSLIFKNGKISVTKNITENDIWN